MKAYTVAIPNLPIIPNKKVLKFLKDIQEYKGYLGLTPMYPHGTLLLFETENDAKVARNRIRKYPGYNGEVGDNITECYIDDRYRRT